jgi:hypothetical protein
MHRQPVQAVAEDDLAYIRDEDRRRGDGDTERAQADGRRGGDRLRDRDIREPRDGDIQQATPDLPRGQGPIAISSALPTTRTATPSDVRAPCTTRAK